jgi:3-hydroxymyristoyl/3-hydroxydecanoyl-(acyl carrier protein) dehydratase
MLADHFGRTPVLPGSLFVELAAQIAGPLCEEAILLRYGLGRGALLAMVRRAVFPRPCFLPATVRLTARVERCDPARVSVRTTASVDNALAFRAELVMALIEVPAEWAEAMEARHQRVARWRSAGAT